MHQSIKSLLITLGFIIVVTTSFYFILYPFSPRSVQTDIYTLRFLGEGWDNRYQIQGDQMTCQQTESYPSTTCTTTFEGKPLTIDITFTDETRHLASYCRVVYDGQPIACEPTINYENAAPTLVVRDTLGISLERFAELRSENPLLYWDESRWIQFAIVIAGLAALGITIWRWYKYPTLAPETSGTVSRLLISLLVGFFSWLGLAWGLGMLVNLLPIGDSAAYWNLIAPLALIGAVIAFMWEWKFLGGWKPETAIFHMIYSIGGGFIIFTILNYLLVGALLFLGFID